MSELAPLVQILDAPVPQLGEQLVDIFSIFRLIDTQTPVVQVIEVPEISLPSCCCRIGAQCAADGRTVGGSAHRCVFLFAPAAFSSWWSFCGTER